MPTNLPPEYFEVEKRYKAARTNQERIELLEELLGAIPKHKGTDKLRADFRRRLSKLKAEAEVRKGAGRRDTAFNVAREGAGQVVLVGPANVGKSSLLAALTNAAPEIAAYPYTTQFPLPGMMPIENVKVQLIDTPPLGREYPEPQLFALIRRADLILLTVDLQAEPIDQLEESLALLEENRIIPAQSRDRCEEQTRLTFIPLLVLVNKADDERCDGDFQALCDLLGTVECPLLPVSAATGRNLDLLRQAVFVKLEIVRIYSKPPGKEPDFTSPFVVHAGATVEDFAGRVHKDFLRDLKSARVWGSAQHPGQMVGRDYVLQDGDIVELKA
jgi:hypothetical protein